MNVVTTAPDTRVLAAEKPFGTTGNPSLYHQRPASSSHGLCGVSPVTPRASDDPDLRSRELCRRCRGFAKMHNIPMPATKPATPHPDFLVPDEKAPFGLRSREGLSYHLRRGAQDTSLCGHRLVKTMAPDKVPVKMGMCGRCRAIAKTHGYNPPRAYPNPPTGTNVPAATGASRDDRHVPLAAIAPEPPPPSARDTYDWLDALATKDPSTASAHALVDIARSLKAIATHLLNP